MKKSTDKKAPEKTICIIPDCGRSGKIVRGLCTKHFAQFRRLKEVMSAEKQADFDADQVKKEKILPPKPGGRPSSGNAFVQDALKYLTPEQQRIINQSDKDIRISEAKKNKK